MVAVLVLLITLRHSRVGGNPWLLFSFSMIILRHSRVGGNPWLLFSFFGNNTASFPRRRESIKYDTSFVGWAKRSVPNALEASIPKVCQATCPNCQAAKSESPHPVFQVAGHACVECSLGFVGHDVEGGLSHDCAPLWIPAFAGMTGEACAGGNPWLLRHIPASCRLGKAERTQRPGGFHSQGLSSYLSELPNCQVRVPTSGFSGCWSRLCRAFPWLCWS